MKDELKRIRKEVTEVTLALSGYYVDICRETTENRNEDKSYPGRESNLAFTEYESKELTASVV
jgi:hypothetical protein